MKIITALLFLMFALAGLSQNTAPHLRRQGTATQTHQGRHIRIPAGEWGIQHVKLYRYK